jgi:hypothetical protein
MPAELLDESPPDNDRGRRSAGYGQPIPAACDTCKLSPGQLVTQVFRQDCEFATLPPVTFLHYRQQAARRAYLVCCCTLSVYMDSYVVQAFVLQGWG